MSVRHQKKSHAVKIPPQRSAGQHYRQGHMAHPVYLYQSALLGTMTATPRPGRASGHLLSVILILSLLVLMAVPFVM